MAFVKGLRILFDTWWRPFLAVLIPLALLPLIILHDSLESRCGFVVLWMAFYFMFEPVPLAVTALLPVATFPILGILSTGEACTPYMKDTIMMYVGSLTLAVAVEHCNLHKRIALKVLLVIGTGARWLMLGFMVTTMFLSMWISNTATTAMMVPIVDAVLDELEKEEKKSLKQDSISLITIPSSMSSSIWDTEYNKSHYQINMQLSNASSSPNKDYRHLRDSLLLSIAYAANCGGTGTVIGSGPNLVLKGLIEELYPESTELTFASWLIYNGPTMIICVFICWIGLQFFYKPCCSKEENNKTQAAARNAVLKSYKELGSITFHEATVATLFLLVVLLWFSRDPKFLDGWSTYLSHGSDIRDATPVIAVCLLLFIIPSKPSLKKRSPPLLEWRVAQKKIPWGVLLLLGSGFVVADAAKKSHLSAWLSFQLSYLNNFSPAVICVLLTFMASILTEVISNMSMATIMLPVVSEMAEAVKVHPLFFMLPVTIGCSFAMILPVGNPSNAIVFEASNMKTFDMMKPGLISKILCCAVELFMIQTLGVAIFDLNMFPTWANKTHFEIGQNSSVTTNWEFLQNATTISHFNSTTFQNG